VAVGPISSSVFGSIPISSLGTDVGCVQGRRATEAGNQAVLEANIKKYDEADDGNRKVTWAASKSGGRGRAPVYVD